MDEFRKPYGECPKRSEFRSPDLLSRSDRCLGPRLPGFAPVRGLEAASLSAISWRLRNFHVSVLRGSDVKVALRSLALWPR